VLLLHALGGGARAWEVWRDTADVPVAAPQNRLDRNWVVVRDGCDALRDELDGYRGSREGAAASGVAAAALGLETCGAAVCLSIGAPAALLGAAADLRRWSGEGPVEAWYLADCDSIELGFITYGAPATVWWLAPDGSKQQPRPLRPREEGTLWVSSRLGHAFVVTAADDREKELGRFVAVHDAIHVLEKGGPPTSRTPASEWAKRERRLSEHERSRARNVKRTWTRRGFDKAPLPADLFADMATYWYNNKATCLAFEEWDSTSAHVNWWAAPPEMCYLPFGLKNKWHDRLLPMVEAWIGGSALERTDLYGIRSYPRGATLLPHVDRESTHAASLIVNIAQYAMDAPWPLQIADLDDDDAMTNVTMAPGEILFYESARCLHGRTAPLEGGAFVSLFAHYRPKRDPTWYKRPNPPGESPLDWAAHADYVAHPYSLGDPSEQRGVAEVVPPTRPYDRDEL